MSKFKPNEEQLEFIKTLDKNILVSASAGSGKTSTMVEKVLRIVKNGTNIDNLLIITYTVASANEMRQRLYHSIVDEIRECADETQIAYLYSQLDSLSNCDIGTIHSVCKKIISKYFYVINQDTNFGIAEQSDYLYSSAIKNVFRKYIVSEDDNFFQLYESYNKKRNEKTLIEIIKTLHNFFNSKVNVTDWKNYVLEKCYDLNVKTNICACYVLEKSKNIAHELIKEFKNLLEIDVDAKYIKLINNRLDFLNSISTASDYNHLLKIIGDASFMTKVATTKLGGEYCDWVEKYEKANANFKTFKDEMLELSKLQWNIDEMSVVRDMTKTLFEIVDDIEVEYKILKQDKNLLDFSDLEHKTLEILNASEDVCKELREKYVYIFVDEYQDINELQEAIIDKIKDAGNLNLIGDVKQSIFAFRLATPKLFIEKYNSYPNSECNRVIKFNQNFRSKNNILQFVNWVCNEVITKNTIGIDYRKDAQLIFPEVKGEDRDGVVEISIIDKKKDGDDDLENDEKEALLIVKKIKEILQKTYTTTAGDHYYTYKDIAIISRSKTALVGKIISALKQYNIPCNVKYKKDIFNSNGVQVVYSFLKLLYNTNDGLSLSILLKNLFGLNENDFAKIKKISNEDFAACCVLYGESGDDLRVKESVLKMYDLIKENTFKMSYLSLYEVLRSFADNIKIKYLSYTDGIDNISQIDEFLRLIDNKLYEHDIKSCIEYLSEIEGSKTEIGDCEGNDAVTITTIHSSKGLEYKAVIFCGLGGNLGINKNTSDIVVSDTFGVGLQYLDVVHRIKSDTIVKQACLYANEREQVNEELRLLYVALTRGMQYLVLTGVYNVENILHPSTKGIYSGRKYFDWIFRGLSSLDRSKFGNLKNFTINENKLSSAKVEIDALESEIVVEPSEIEFSTASNSLLERVSQNLAWSYPYENQISLPIKNSVSSILKDDKDYENSVDAFKELSLSERISPSESIEKGNAYHRVMQEVDFIKDNDLEQILSVFDKNRYVDKKKVKICIDTIKCLASNCIVEKEKQFLMKVRHSDIVDGGQEQKILVQGIVDLFLIDDEGITLIDYKTNKVSTLENLAKMYATQMRLYALALEKGYGKKVKNIYLYSFDKDCLVDMKNYIK